MEKNAHKNRTALELLQDRIAELGISLTEPALRGAENETRTAFIISLLINYL